MSTITDPKAVRDQIKAKGRFYAEDPPLLRVYRYYSTLGKSNNSFKLIFQGQGDPFWGNDELEFCKKITLLWDHESGLTVPGEVFMSEAA